MKKRFDIKTIVALALCVLTLCVLCACGDDAKSSAQVKPDRGITVAEFEAKAKECGLKIPVMNNVVHAGVLDSSIVYKGDSSILWQAEYYIMSNEESAIATFDNAKETFQQQEGEESSVDDGNKISYEKIGDQKYQYVSRIGTTLVYIDVPSQYMSEVKDFIKAIGY